MTDNERQLRAVVKQQINSIKEILIEPAGVSVILSNGADNIVRVITDKSPDHGYIFPNIRTTYYRAMVKKIREYESKNK